MSDSIDAFFDDDVEAGADEELSKVFDEIGLDIKTRVSRRSARSTSKSKYPSLRADIYVCYSINQFVNWGMAMGRGWSMSLLL